LKALAGSSRTRRTEILRCAGSRVTTDDPCPTPYRIKIHSSLPAVQSQQYAVYSSRKGDRLAGVVSSPARVRVARIAKGNIKPVR